MAALTSSDISVRMLKSVGGMRHRFLTITLNATYTTPGYTITPALCKLKNKILYMSSPNVGIYSASVTLSGVNAVLQMIVGAAGINAEAADNLAGLNGKVAIFDVWGY